ncbi:right-handed parallel beta-helix repeat-containing protein [Arthrobacter sp. AZCC_0090]|uniref:right-handed parallel beta-helix repeat-containing protein n=1 Tax=Arthrobacter sp. AZCC_0090 TaxID=2735881 RepID=UPI001616CBD2|nr:right-handed parallel beta-helix repeat-containing protein [Arthrobacter sp. AZCC_0090]MBB6406796.1 hypothetical protein [Arthrobacter sp. AZCC_0090]
MRTRPVIRSGLIAGSLLLSFAVNIGTAQAAKPNTLYVSPTGSGSTCAITAPCSLTEAQQVVRQLTPSMTDDLTVLLRGGTYRVSEPISFGPQDSGTGGHKVVWAAFPGQKPVISGAEKVAGFSLYDSAKHIYRASVPAGTVSRQLFVNGVRADRARSALNPPGFTLAGSSFTTADPSFASFTNQNQIEVAFNSAWKHMRCPLASITASGSGSSLNVSPACFNNNNTNVPHPGFPFNGSGLPRLTGITWLENAYELLNQQGQFYLDSTKGELYYIPRAGEDLSTADVELPVAQTLLDVAGTPGHLAPVNDNDSHATYTGAWSVSAGRGTNDFNSDVHYTTTNGDSVSYSFTGAGLQVLSEVNSDEGNIDVYVDGTKTQSVSASAPSRRGQQPIVTITGLPRGQHTVKLVKTSGQFMLVDAFTVIPDAVTPVHDITFRGIGFTYATWNQPTTDGYIDNQAGVLWDPVTHAPIRIPAAVQVHRGDGITFERNTFGHLGGTGLDLADGTQNSVVNGNIITDTSGGGISLGEADDYYQNQTALMTSGNTVSNNTITYVGQDYKDAVGIWVGYTRNVAVSHNDIGFTPYSGISLGWGWGYASSYGTTYAGANQIVGNSVHNVMRVLHDGGPIYTLGGQGGGDGSMTSLLAGNVVAEGNNTNNMLYQDEGSSYWNTHDNLVRFGGANWIGMWIRSIHDINIHDNYSDNPRYNNNGTDITFNQATIVTNGAWPPAAQAIIAAAGPDEKYRPKTGLFDDDEPTIAYLGSWSASANRGLGDLNDGIHYTSADGASAAFAFTGTGIKVIGEKNSDQGLVEVYIDGISQGQVDTSAVSRQVQQAIYSTQNLAQGTHTVTIVKRSGAVMTLDGFAFTTSDSGNDTDASSDS